MPSFELDRCHHAKRRVPSLPVVPDLEILEDRCRQLDPSLPPSGVQQFDLHPLDNLSAHKSQPVRDWLDHPKRRRWHLHFTPTSSSWLNLIETWFSVLTRKALTNSSFQSLTELQDRIDWWVENWNADPEPFVWTRAAEEIIERVTRDRATLDRITKSATHH